MSHLQYVSWSQLQGVSSAKEPMVGLPVPQTVVRKQSSSEIVRASSHSAVSRYLCGGREKKPEKAGLVSKHEDFHGSMGEGSAQTTVSSESELFPLWVQVESKEECSPVISSLDWDSEDIGSLSGSTTGLLANLGQVTLSSLFKFYLLPRAQFDLTAKILKTIYASDLHWFPLPAKIAFTGNLEPRHPEQLGFEFSWQFAVLL